LIELVEPMQQRPVRLLDPAWLPYEPGAPQAQRRGSDGWFSGGFLD